MSEGPLNHPYAGVPAARAAFSAGANVTAAIRQAEGVAANPPHAVEIAYELQAGSYARSAESDPDRWDAYGREIAHHLAPILAPGDTLLDCGTGEMTSLVAALNHTTATVRPYAFDVSWSRIAHGRRFARRHATTGTIPTAFVGDISAIPLADEAVDVAITVHALEPNGGREVPLLRELLRVTRRHLVLFEPCFERASPEARERMRHHGYISGLEEAIGTAGGRLRSITEFARPANPKNPTWVFTVEKDGAPGRAKPRYRCPVTATPLRPLHGVMFSDEAGLAYPVIADIPVLRPEHAVLATQLETLGSTA